DKLFQGRLPGYEGCDTVYHDRQHSLDITLAMARLLVGYDKSCAEADRLGRERVIMGITVALYHDAGYMRRSNEPERANGAEFTPWHVSRSADFLRSYLPGIGLEHWADVATRIVHFTGYELNVDDIELDDPLDSLTGHFLGTADLMAQMADRCYLEKCRDRLYSEFVLAGVAFSDRDGITNHPGGVSYASGIDLLRKTPDFYQQMAMKRLDEKFNQAYRYIEVLYDGDNPYFEFIEKNLEHLHRVIERDDWGRLRRNPPCFTVLDHPLNSVSALVSRKLADLNAPASALTTQGD
ncbi:MAG: hypothetical protein ACE5G3_03245, partial [Gammaproteobacteria bacterium]